jgi:toxin ParE1/3/4
MRLSVNSKAAEELLSATRYYIANAPAGKAAEFVEAVRVTQKAILEAPLRQTILGRDVRRWRVKGFPYAIFYRVRGEVVRVLGYQHDRRRPGIWRGRE